MKVQDTTETDNNEWSMKYMGQLARSVIHEHCL